MSYVLVHKKRVIFGPKEWNHRIFGEVYNQEFGDGCRLPTTKNDDEPIYINDDTVIFKAELMYPKYNPTIEYLHGPFWEFDEQATGTFQVLPISVDNIKSTLKQKVTENRWKKENSGTTVKLRGVTRKISTDRETRVVLAQALQISEISGVPDYNWKFEDGWETLSNPHFKAMGLAMAAHVQSCFDWEKAKWEEIDACETAEQLDAVKLDFEE